MVIGVDPGSRQLPTEADAEADADQLFTNLTAILAAAGAELPDVVRVAIQDRGPGRRGPATSAER